MKLRRPFIPLEVCDDGRFLTGFTPFLNYKILNYIRYIRFADVISLGENDKTDVFSFFPRFNYIRFAM